MRLIRATQAEAAGMAHAHAGAFADSWREEDFEDLLEGDGVFGFLATGDDRAPLGVILCRIAAGEMEVLTLGVRPEARRLGVAKALMTAALGVARQSGAEACFLEVAVDNDSAAALYAGLGFHRAGKRRNYYDRGPEGLVDAWVLRLDLKANDQP